jgi:hypothetical protein
LALPPGNDDIVGIVAHFDSVPGTPGADDNASAVAVMLGVAKALAIAGLLHRVGFVAFNAEEDGIIGSAELARLWRDAGHPRVEVVHVLEMVGFCSHEKGSQSKLPGLLQRVDTPDVGDFLGLLANHGSRPALNDVFKVAKRMTPIPLLGLQTYFGFERFLPSMDLSDHVRFWEVGIPAVMWTDTAFYRNPNYHRPTDTPDTLDPEFMSGVAHLLFEVIRYQVS